MFHWLQYAVAALALLGVAYYLLCLWSAASFLLARRRSRAVNGEAAFTPAVTILKPVLGADPGAYESFRSHCLQDYPQYEIIFGVGDANDAAVPLIQQLMREFPQRQIKLVVCAQKRGMNRKVSNLLQMLPQAQHQYLLVNDGDIRVRPDYLRRVMAPFAGDRVGMVTCLYHGIAASTLGSKLEALGISTDFSAGVLTARQVEGGIRFALGSTLAFSREALDSVGGLEPLVDYLADDYQLGRRISAQGYKVLLADVNVETFVPGYSFREFFLHQLRWARSTRDSRRWGYTGLVLTFGLPWSMMSAVLAHGTLWSWRVLAAALGTRLLMALTVGVGVLRDRQVWRDLVLIPLRDLIAVVVWATSFLGHQVSWRGTSFILENGKLRPAA